MPELKGAFVAEVGIGSHRNAAEAASNPTRWGAPQHK